MHLDLEDATDELKRMEELENAWKELEKNKEEKPVSQKVFTSRFHTDIKTFIFKQPFFELENRVVESRKVNGR